MTHCLASAAALLDNDEWFEIAKKFVEKNILERKKLFYKIDREPKDRGPGGHDFFSENANKALALLSTFSQEETTKTCQHFLAPKISLRENHGPHSSMHTHMLQLFQISVISSQS